MKDGEGHRWDADSSVSKARRHQQPARTWDLRPKAMLDHANLDEPGGRFSPAGLQIKAQPDQYLDLRLERH